MITQYLEDKDKYMIDYLRKEVSNGNLNNYINTDSWLNYWAEAKNSFFEAFNHNFILQKKIVITEESTKLTRSIRNLLGSLECLSFIGHLCDHIKRYKKNSFIHIDSLIKDYIFTINDFINNVYTGPSCTIYGPNGYSYKIIQKSKIMRILSKLSKMFNLENLFEPVRLAHSQIMNEARIEATLYLSIHPLDYMTASYNNNDWRSCMHWFDGEYRRGVVEMMNSPNVICAYISSDHEDIQLGNYNWNSKRWREFFIITKDAIVGIKGYPYWNRDLENTCIFWLKEIFTSEDNTYSDETYQIKNVVTINDNKIYFDFECGPAMYNDFREQHYGVISNQIFDRHNQAKDLTLDVDYSGPSECVVCGSCDKEFECEGDLICNNCAPSYFCCHCGERIWDLEDDLITFNGRYYHADCYNSLLTCDICEEKAVDLSIDRDDGEEFVLCKSEKTPNIIYTNNFSRPETFICCDECAKTYLIPNTFFRSRHSLFATRYSIASAEKMPKYFYDHWIDNDFGKYTKKDNSEIITI